MENAIPNTTTPIIIDGGGENIPEVQAGLGPLLGFVGTWNNPNTTPGNSQLGYNVMPLPQNGTPASDNVIVKDFHYYEEMTFSAIPGDAANRGGDYQQNCWVLFYEQRVYFGSDAGPQENALVHAENGDWLHLVNVTQDRGVIEDPADPIPSTFTQPAFPIIKQVSVPHGNSILAPGTSETRKQPPGGPGLTPIIPDVSTIPTTATGTPSPALLSIFNDGNYDRSNPMLNPNIILWAPLTGKTIKEITTYKVSSQNPGGAVTNIQFEKKKANVSAFHSTFWLNTFEDGSTLLQYSQTIEMEFAGNPGVTFYHIDAASMTPVS